MKRYWRRVAGQAWVETWRKPSLQGTAGSVAIAIVAGAITILLTDAGREGVILGVAVAIAALAVVASVVFLYHFALAPAKLDRERLATIADHEGKLGLPGADARIALQHLNREGYAILDKARYRVRNPGILPGAGFEAVEDWRTRLYTQLRAQHVDQVIFDKFSKANVSRSYDPPDPTGAFSTKTGGARVAALEAWLAELESVIAALDKS